MGGKSERLWRFTIDVGGTFTDCVARSPSGAEQTAKVLSSSVLKGKFVSDAVDQHTARSLRADQAWLQRPAGFWVNYDLAWQSATGATLAIRRVVASSPEQGLQWAEPLSPEVCAGARQIELRSPEPSPLLAVRWILGLGLRESLPPLAMDLGTTRGTNALLTRRGARTALLVTRGLADLLRIGDQDRPALFELTIRRPAPLTDTVREIDERLTAAGEVLVPLDEASTRDVLADLRRDGWESLAICLLHAYRNPIHEEQIATWARELGFTEISLSSRVSPLIKLIPRAETTVLDAYLNPVIREYADRIARGLSPGSTLQFMTSSGTLVSRQRFTGKESVLSGPAAGVVGFARGAEQAGFERAIGFDMGGTSTDVARYDRGFEWEFETRKAGVRMVTPLLAIETVAAGGGSICRVSGSRLTVGPESAASDPGPACYGNGGPLAVTDLNVYLGRIREDHFPFPLDRAAVERRVAEAHAELPSAIRLEWDLARLVTGFWEVANHNMAAAIRTVSVARGYDPQDYLLVAFGGAGPQHACGVAEHLGIPRILIHPWGSVLSAAGIGWAERATHDARTVLRLWTSELLSQLEPAFLQMEQECQSQLAMDHGGASGAELIRSLDLRFAGTEPFLNIAQPRDGDYRGAFEQRHLLEYGYLPERPIEVVAQRVTCVLRVPPRPVAGRAPTTRAVPPNQRQRFWSAGQWVEGACHDWGNLQPGDCISGPALIADELTTVVVETGWQAEVLLERQLLLERPNNATANTATELSAAGSAAVANPVYLEIFSNQFLAIARQMGYTLQRTAVSVNVKDRLDFSCALFNRAGDLVVNAPHIPVHLGAMSATVRELIRKNPQVEPGDVFITNDPYGGGSHLPDVTVVTPVFVEKRLAFWVASRGHHAEIGGRTPGSMPPDATCLADEGVLISNFRLIAAGQERLDELEQLLRSGAYPSRNVADNLADVRAQIAANQAGVRGLQALVEQWGLPHVESYMNFLLDTAETQVREALRLLPDGEFEFEDRLDNGRRIQVRLEKWDSELQVDFSGTDPVSPDNLNANPAICWAAIMYVLRCLVNSSLPLNEGILRPVRLILPTCFLNPQPGPTPETSPAIVGGNVETSQRVVDVLLGAWQLAAASQGTMNNWLMGNSRFGYYETLGGGSGGTPCGPGADAVHTHMSNTRLTDPEILESRYPVRLWQWGIARGTGGAGRHPGGCGMIRSVEFLEPLTVSLLTSRRNSRPYGLAGGEPGQAGRNEWWHKQTETTELLPSRAAFAAQIGDRLTLITPGGGGWGALET